MDVGSEMSTPDSKKPSNGVDKDDKGEKSHDNTIAKAAGAVIATGIAWSVFRTFWSKKSVEEDYETVKEEASTLEAEGKEKAEEFADKASSTGSSISKKFPKFPRKAKFGQAYEVCYGDTLYGISRKYEVSVDALKAANGLSGDVIVVGEKLNIPS